MKPRQPEPDGSVSTEPPVELGQGKGKEVSRRGPPGRREAAASPAGWRACWRPSSDPSSGLWPAMRGEAELALAWPACLQPVGGDWRAERQGRRGGRGGRRLEGSGERENEIN
jgi:hypothetical protein